MRAGSLRHTIGKLSTRGYNFALEFIAIGGLHAKLWAPKVAGVLVVENFEKTFGCGPRGEVQSIL